MSTTTSIKRALGAAAATLLAAVSVTACDNSETKSESGDTNKADDKKQPDHPQNPTTQKTTKRTVRQPL